MKSLKIFLEKETYYAGETVKGTLDLQTNRAIKLQDFNFCSRNRTYKVLRAYGAPFYEIFKYRSFL
jgi:hypothetical protein